MRDRSSGRPKSGGRPGISPGISPGAKPAAKPGSTHSGGKPGSAHPSAKPSTAHPGTKPGTTHEQRDRRERFERARRESLRPDDLTVLYGWHTVKAALENPARKVRKFLATENAARRLTEEGVTASPELVRPGAIDERLAPDAVHQGLYLEADPLPSPDIAEIVGGPVLVLDQITDPHNVGAILRTAAGFDVAAVVTTARHSPEATGALAKAASGALEYVPIVTVQNLARAMAELKERGYLLVGLNSTSDVDLGDVPLRVPLALVLGAEGKGLRQLTRESCDHVGRLELPGRIKSLNVSNAAALALYVATKRLVLAVSNANAAARGKAAGRRSAGRHRDKAASGAAAPASGWCRCPGRNRPGPGRRHRSAASRRGCKRPPAAPRPRTARGSSTASRRSPMKPKRRPIAR